MAFALVSLGNHQMSEFSPLQYLVNTLNVKAYRDVAIAFLTELARDSASPAGDLPGPDAGHAR